MGRPAADRTDGLAITARREPRLAEAAELAAEHNLTPARITSLYTGRTTNTTGQAFPEPLAKRGRARLWDQTEVAEWFAHRAPARLTVHTPPSLDPETLLNAAQSSRYLGYKNPNQFTTFIRDHPGYFPDPDVVKEFGTTANPYRRQLWQVATLQAWMATRPGRGRRAGVKQAPPLPDVPVDGDPDELLGASQAAALLGFKSINSFSSSLAQGNLPRLQTTDATAPEGRQKGRRRWTRRILEQAAQRAIKHNR
jgi:hypothetical protein